MKEYKVPKGFTKVGNEYPQIDEEAPIYLEPMYVREDENPIKIDTLKWVLM